MVACVSIYVHMRIWMDLPVVFACIIVFTYWICSGAYQPTRYIYIHVYILRAWVSGFLPCSCFQAKYPLATLSPACVAHSSMPNRWDDSGRQWPLELHRTLPAPPLDGHFAVQHLQWIFSKVEPKNHNPKPKTPQTQNFNIFGLNFHLVGGLEHFLFSHILGIIISTDELHHFSEGLQPQTLGFSIETIWLLGYPHD